MLAGHIDTVPLADPPTCRPGTRATSCAAAAPVDMKGGVAVQLRLARQVPSRAATSPSSSTTARRSTPSSTAWPTSPRAARSCSRRDFAVLLEPTVGAVEGGCKGTLRVEVIDQGHRGPLGAAVEGPQRHPRRRRRAAPARGLRAADGRRRRPGLPRGPQRSASSGGIAGNVIPDRCVVTVNYRYAPDKTRPRTPTPTCARCSTASRSSSPTTRRGARPGLTCRRPRPSSRPSASPVGPKEGWTDVARFSALGVAAVNFGPGDPNLAHADDERVPVQQ